MSADCLRLNIPSAIFLHLSELGVELIYVLFSVYMYCAAVADGTVRLLDSADMPTTGEMAGIVEMFIGNR